MMQLTRRGRLLMAVGVACVVLAGITLASAPGMEGRPQVAGAVGPGPEVGPSGTASPASVTPAASPTPLPTPVVPGPPPAAPPNPAGAPFVAPPAVVPPGPQPPPGVEPLAASAPMLVEIRSIGVHAKLTRVGLDSKGWIDAPPARDRNLAAWYEGSPTPGAPGTSVVVGHVDVPDGPAVFYDLAAIRKGDTVRVPREDGSTAVFTVYAVQVFGKKDFPADRVYGDTGAPELRVITCGGKYDKQNGYTGNIVAFARLTGSE